VAEIDIDTVTERVTSEQSAARSAPFGNRAAGVSKPKRFRPRGGNGGGAKRSGGERRVTKRGDGFAARTEVWRSAAVRLLEPNGSDRPPSLLGPRHSANTHR